MLNEMLTVKEAAEALGVHKQTVYKLIWAEKIGHFRFGLEGQRILIPHQELEAYKSRSFHTAS